MNKKVKEALARLVERRDAAALTDDDWAALDALVGQRAAVDADAPRPLWAYMRAQVARWKPLLELPLDWIGTELDTILLEAGADPALRFDNARTRKAAVVTRAALSASVKKHLGHDQGGLRGWAYLLIGLCRLDEHVDAMVDALASGREEREAWTMTTTVPPILESLAMLEHPRAAELARKYLNHSDDRLRRAAQVCTLQRPPEDPKALAEALDAGIAATVMIGFPDELVRAQAGGFDLEPRLRALASSHYRGADHGAIGAMARAGGLDALHRDLVTSSSNYEGRIVMLHDAIASGRVEAFADMLAHEGDDNAICALIAGIAVHTADEAARRAFLDDKLRNGNAAARIGAALAAVTVPTGLDEAFAAAATDYDAEVHAAMLFGAAGRCTPPSVELLDIAALRLARSWRLQLCGLAGAVLRAARIPLPDAVRDAEYATTRQPPWAQAWWDEQRAFYRRRPDLLVRRLHAEVGRDAEVRLRMCRIAGELGGAVMEEALEQRLACADSVDEAGELYLECLCHGGPRDEVARIVGLVSLHEAAHPVTLPPGALPAAVLVSTRQDTLLRSRAVALLHQLGDDAEPYLRAFAHALTDAPAGKALGQSLGQVHGARDPVVGELARLMSGEAHRLDELELPELAAGAGAPAIRAKLAELGAGDDDTALVRLLVTLAGDLVDDVALAGVTALARRRGDTPWLRELLLAQSRSSNWTLSRQAIDVMGSTGSAGFVPRLVEILATAQSSNDVDLGNRCVNALQNLADASPALGLLVLDIREPHVVNTRYGLGETVDWNADRRAEAHRLLLAALDQRKRPERAEAAKGRTALFARPGAQGAAVGQTVPADELESLLVYFKVTFADEETGSIVAEVGDEATGELLTALLATGQVAVITASWS